MIPADDPSGDAYASLVTLFVAQNLAALRRARAELTARIEDAQNVLRFELEQRGKKSCEFPTLEIRLNIRRSTVCSCHGENVWDCSEAKDGQAITTREIELPRYVDVVEKALPTGVLRVAK